jgi:thioredoxin 2
MATLELDDRGVLLSCGACGQVNRLTYERLDDPMRCGRCRQDIRMPAGPFDVGNVADFDRLVARSSLPIVVDYWAPWCGPCRMVAPELEKVAARNAGRLIVAKVNTDVLTELGQRYGIRSIPTMAVFAEGKELARTSGARPAADIEDFVAHATRDLARRTREV